jgi:gamma-tubulin complex component 5
MALDPSRVPLHLQRPGSSHSNRSVSRTSQRSTSRLSQRSIIRQPRLAVLLKTLVKQVTKQNESDASENIQERMDMAIKRIDQMRQGSVPDLAQIDTQIRGHVKKARVNIQDSLANTLTAKYAEIKEIAAQRNDLDMEMKLATLPSHLYFLVSDHPQLIESRLSLLS